MREEKRDLFALKPERGHWLAHCISADFALGAGIARSFAKRYLMRDMLKFVYPDYKWTGKGDCLIIACPPVFNLVTKGKYYEKPTYESLRQALTVMQHMCVDMGVHNLAMPRIGCRLDRLDWGIVKKTIEDVFDYTDIDILICNWNPKEDVTNV